jgi:zinc transport system permease protein
METWLNNLIQFINGLAPPGTFLAWDFNVRGMLAVILASLICGAIGSLVVANRMAFFSDALAHCAFAGVALGLLMGVFTGAETEAAFNLWITLIMVAFGITVGLAIAVVRETTGQSSDTVIGVFFAGAIGLGAIFLKAGSGKRFMPPEQFLFGNILTFPTAELLVLFGLAALTAGLLAWLYNDLTLTSFNRSLALSRRIRVRLCSYLFIVLLALIVNLCLKVVGALLINALLIVPAATAARLCRNMRQLFWGSIGLCLLAGVGGHWLSWELSIPVVGQRQWAHPGESGTIVLLSVLLFFILPPLVGLLRQLREPAPPAARELEDGFIGSHSREPINQPLTSQGRAEEK